jgi:transposase
MEKDKRPVPPTVKSSDGSESAAFDGLDNLLRLPGYRVTEVREAEYDYHVFAETVAIIPACPFCIGSRCVGYGRSQVLIKDLPIHGKRVGLYINARRYKCRDCHRTFMESLSAVDEKYRMTQRLAQWVGPRSLQRTFTSVAEEIGVAEGTVRNLAHGYIADLAREYRFETPIYMGIDEIHLLSRPRAVITNLDENTVIDLLPDRDKRRLVRYLLSVPDRHQIEVVAMDMWKPYRDAVREALPDATIVIDKFHVLRMANQAIDELRRSLSRTNSSDSLRRKAAGTKRDAYLFRKREKDLSDSERLILDGWLRSIPELREAWRLKEAFYAVYDAETRLEAKKRFRTWAASIPPECGPAFQPILTAWGNWEPHILAYFDYSVTNALTESLNNLIRFTNRMGRGYSFDVLRARVLFTNGTHKTRLQRPKFNRELPTEGFFRIDFLAPGLGTVVNLGVDPGLLLRTLDSQGG